MFSEVRSFKPLEMRVVFLFYALLAVLAAIWDWSSRGDPLYAWINSQTPSLVFFSTATLCVLGYFFLVRIVAKFLEPVRVLDGLFIQLLTPISYLQILLLSLMSGFVEEWLFRGVFIPHFGIMLSSVAFGLCHFIPAPKLWIWWLWSTVMGLVLGSLMLNTHSLWASAYVHFVINFVGLWHLNWKAYQAPRFSSPTSGI